MPAYRLYEIDGSGRFHGTEVVEASSDEEAISIAIELLGGSSGELWLAAKLVWRCPGTAE